MLQEEVKQQPLHDHFEAAMMSLIKEVEWVWTSTNQPKKQERVSQADLTGWNRKEFGHQRAQVHWWRLQLRARHEDLYVL